MTNNTFDRTAVDVGNIVFFEHINVTVPDLGLATLFYNNAMGFTRDPYVDLGPTLVWFNLGRQQFHIPLGEPQALRGTIDITTPSLDALEVRLRAVADHLAGTRFDFEIGTNMISVTGPWGNRFLCRQPGPGRQTELGISGAELPVPEGTAAGIGRFYDQVFGTPAAVTSGLCTVKVGPEQELRFRETADQIEPYNGHHIAVYVADFSGPHGWLNERQLIVEETSEHQYRYNWIVDPDSGEPLFELEHEVRSLHHPLHQRPLINRNPEQNLMSYIPGADPFQPRSSAGDDSFSSMQDIISTIG